MPKNEMSLNTKVEVALEILDNKIGEEYNKNKDINSKKYLELQAEREMLYSGNKEILDKIITQYGPEIKKKLEEEE